MNDAIIHPPWSPQQVDALNRWQQCEWVHPFTCPYDHHIEYSRVLIATGDGWVCPTCTYTQNWAHIMMTGALPPKPDFIK